MSSKASQQPQQQSSWRTAASKPYRQTDRPTENRQSSPQEQHQNGQRDGFNKFDSWEKPGPVDRSDRFGRNGSPAGLTPSSKSSTKPPSASASASPFEAADNMMPSFARNQQRNSTSNLHQQQQQQQFQPQGSNSVERNGSMIGTNTHNQQDDKVNQEKRKSLAGEINGEHNKQTNADNEQMRKSNKKSSSSSSSSPPPEMDGNNDKQVEQKEQMAEQTKEQSVALVSPEAVIKHPLKNKWAMWYFKNDKSKDWKDNQKKVLSFNTVEDFWALYNHMVQPSELQSGCDYSLFKEGIEPMWEDPSNKDGGRWLINSMKQQRQYLLDRLWMETLLCLVGEIFENASDEVCGTVINIRPKGDKLGIWTRNAEEQDKNLVVGRGLREKLGLPKQLQLGFQAHKDTITKYGSVTPNKYYA